MHEDEQERKADGGCEVWCGGYAPCKTGEEHKEGEKVGKGWIGAGVCVLSLCSILS